MYQKLIKSDFPAGILDIEELVQFSREKSVCAYYLGRSKAEKAEVLLLPYNYLLDEKLRKRHKIDVSNKIIILDEAHNIESVCESASSYEINSTDIAGAIREVDQVNEVIQKIDDEGGTVSAAFENDKDEKAAKSLKELLERSAVLKLALLQLESGVEVHFTKLVTENKDGKALDPMVLYQVLSDAGFTPASLLELNAIVEQITSLISEKTGTKGMKLAKVLDLLSVFQDIPTEDLTKEMGKYRLFVKKEAPKHHRAKEEQLFQDHSWKG